MKIIYVDHRNIQARSCSSFGPGHILSAALAQPRPEMRSNEHPGAVIDGRASPPRKAMPAPCEAIASIALLLRSSLTVRSPLREVKAIPNGT